MGRRAGRAHRRPPRPGRRRGRRPSPGAGEARHHPGVVGVAPAVDAEGLELGVGDVVRSGDDRPAGHRHDRVDPGAPGRHPAPRPVDRLARAAPGTQQQLGDGVGGCGWVAGHAPSSSGAGVRVARHRSNTASGSAGLAPDAATASRCRPAPTRSARPARRPRGGRARPRGRRSFDPFVSPGRRCRRCRGRRPPRSSGRSTGRRPPAPAPPVRRSRSRRPSTR